MPPNFCDALQCPMAFGLRVCYRKGLDRHYVQVWINIVSTGVKNMLKGHMVFLQYQLCNVLLF